ncbi:hypothetical protein F1Z41_00120 [Clostridium perfringens]|nr:hypothetical protein [Clostridium perfringens]
MKLFLRYLIYSIIIWVIGFIILIMIPQFLWIPLLIILVIISNINWILYSVRKDKLNKNRLSDLDHLVYFFLTYFYSTVIRRTISTI